MKFRINSWIAASSMILAVSGCSEPREIAPVAPPGFELARVPATPQGDGAQAIGEQDTSKKSTVKPLEGPARKPTPETPAKPEEPAPAPIGPPVKSASGLVYEVLKEGKGEVAKVGQTVTMHYTGTLENGTVFDSSRRKNRPFNTVIGVGQVIKGWDEGVPGMKIGERRRLIIPSSLGYGASGQGPIPPNATLIFDVELLDVK